MQAIASNSTSGLDRADWSITRNVNERHINERHINELDIETLDSFCQLQAEQLATHPAIQWAQIVYYDPCLKTHQQVTSGQEGLSPETIAYLKSNDWLSDFPLVLTLTEVIVSPSNPVSSLKGYFCPIGYRDCQPEYLLVVTQEALSPGLRGRLIQCATLLTKHFQLYSNFHQQKVENQLLEHIIQRVGHQLRNPLSLIALYAENLRLELQPGGTQDQAIVIRETVQQTLTQLTELIYCGKSSQIRMALQDLQQLVTESIQGLQPWIEQKQIQIIYPSTSVMLPLDRLQMKQVFDNLLSNAIHFSPTTGIIRIDWQVFQGEVLIHITDQGSGLSPTDLQKIFTPFYSRRSGGTGLGLTIAQKVVLDHQGSLWAQNLPEGGARFSFTLPRSMMTSEAQ